MNRNVMYRCLRALVLTKYGVIIFNKSNGSFLLIEAEGHTRLAELDSFESLFEDIEVRFEDKCDELVRLLNTYWVQNIQEDMKVLMANYPDACTQSD